MKNNIQYTYGLQGRIHYRYSVDPEEFQWRYDPRLITLHSTHKDWISLPILSEKTLIESADTFKNNFLSLPKNKYSDEFFTRFSEDYKYTNFVDCKYTYDELINIPNNLVDQTLKARNEFNSRVASEILSNLDED